MDVFDIKYENENDGDLFAISIVDSPANGHQFIAMSEQHKKIVLADKKKQILTGVVLVPEQLIYREWEDGTPFNLKFSKETIEKLSQDFMRKGYQLNSTYNHDNNFLDGIAVVEQWLIEDPENDKANALGFKNLPKGTWMVSMKLSDKLWKEYIETGKAKGFSIDSFLDLKKVSMSMNKNNKIKKEEKMSLLKKLIKMFSEDVKLETITIEGMGELTADAFEVNNIVYADIDGEMLPLVSSSFTYEGFVYTTDADGMIVEKMVETSSEVVEMGSIMANDNVLTIYFDGSVLSLGKEVYSDEAMTLPLEPGKYVLESGVTLVVTEPGIAGEFIEAEPIEMEEIVDSSTPKIIEDVAEVISDVADAPVEEVDVEALKMLVEELQKQIEILTKEKETIISENVEMKTQLSKIPNSSKLRTNEVKLNKTQTTVSVLREIIEKGNQK